MKRFENSENDPKNNLIMAVLSALVMGLLIYLVYHFNVPNPNMILITAMVFFTGFGGPVPGAVSAVMMLLYSMYFFSTDGSFFRYTEVNLQKILVIVFGIAVNFIVVFILKKNQDAARQELQDTNEYLTLANKQLSDKADAAVKFAELEKMKNETNIIRKAYEEAKTESLTYNHIAQALASDYTFIYYLDLETDEFTEYIPDPAHNELTFVRFESDFFTKSYKDAKKMIYEKDLKDFIAAFTKENIIRELDYQGRFSLNYRLMINDVPTYVNMKAIRMNGDSRHIVIGVRDIDKQIRQEEAAERIKEERTIYSRIQALTRNYIAIYTVDPESGHYQEYSGSKIYDELGFKKKGENFFAQVLIDMKKSIHPQDQPRFRELFTKENILREIETNGIFSIDYRLIFDRKFIYVSLNAALVDEKDGKHLIIGVNNIDAQVKRDREYEQNLNEAKIRANRDELTGVKNKHAYAELEEELNEQIRTNQEIQFAVCVFDVNDLKPVNDTQGHKAGDDLLKKACSMICLTFAHSPVFRIGGDEFAVISRGHDYEHIDELMAEMDQTNQKNRENGEANVAMGMARYEGESSVSEVFEKADQMMYRNKREQKG